MKHTAMRWTRLALSAIVILACASEANTAYAGSTLRDLALRLGPSQAIYSNGTQAANGASTAGGARFDSLLPSNLRSDFYKRLRQQSFLAGQGRAGGNTAGSGQGPAQQTPKDLDLTYFDNSGLPGQVSPPKNALPNNQAPYTDWEPAFAADRHTIFFSSSRSLDGSANATGYHLWMMQSDGSFQQPLQVKVGNAVKTPQGTDQQWPAISADGNKLAYSSRDAQGVAQLHILDLNTGADAQITTGNGDKTHPTWSRGQVLAFQSNESGITKIWVVFPNLGPGQDPTTSIRTQLTGVGNDLAYASDVDSAPAWEPNGAHLAFARFDGRHNRIWLISGVTFLPDGTLSANAAHQLTDFKAANGVESDDHFPAWRPEGQDFNFDNPGNDALAFASTRKSSADTNLQQSGANSVGTTYGIYRIPINYTDAGQTVPVIESKSSPAIVVTEDVQHPGFTYSNIMPAWSPESKVDPVTGVQHVANRIAYASNASIQYTTPAAPMTGPEPFYDIWSSEVFDFTPPTPDALPEVTPRQTAPGQPVTIKAHIVDLNSGVAHVYAQIKNPNSWAQDSRLPSLRNGIDGKNVYLSYLPYFGEDIDFELFSFNLPPAMVFDGHRIYQLTWMQYPSFVPGGTVPPGIYHTFDEIGYQPVNPDAAQIRQTGGDPYSDGGKDNLPFDLQTLATNGIATGILNGQPPDSIELKQDPNDPTLFTATWTTDPGLDTDYLVDLICVDKAGNAIDYDNSWGFSTKQFQAGNNSILLVSDYVTPQQFLAPRGSLLNGGLAGVESWLTDNPLAKNGNSPPSGGQTDPYFDLNLPVNQVNTVDWMNFVIPFQPNPVPKPPIDPNFLWGFANTLGLGSWVDVNAAGQLPIIGDTSMDIFCNGDEQAFLNQVVVGWPIQEGSFLPQFNTDSYDIWRVLCRGPIPSDILEAYGPVNVQEPDPMNVQNTISAKTHPRCAVWASPFTADEWVGPGTILDPAMQAEIAQYLDTGGRMFLTGQDIAWALSNNDPMSNIASHNFLRKYFGIQFAQDQQLPLGDNINSQTGPIGIRWQKGVSNNEGPDSPVNALAWYNSNDFSVAQTEYAHFPAIPLWGAHDQDFADTLTSQMGAFTDYQQAAGGVDVVSTSVPATTAKTVYSGFGIEGITEGIRNESWTFMRADPANNPPDCTKRVAQPVRQFTSDNQRSILMHGIVDWMRENSATGQANILEPDGRLQPLPGALITAVLDIAGANPPVIATALTRADGSFTVPSIPTGEGGGSELAPGGLTVLTGEVTAIGFDPFSAFTHWVDRIEGGPGTRILVARPGYTQVHDIPRILGHAGQIFVVYPSGSNNFAGTLTVLVSVISPGTIEGLVTDASTGAPIKGATVNLTNIPFSDVQETVVTTDVKTDANGNKYNYIFTSVPATPAPQPGQAQSHYTLSFTAPKHLPAVKLTDSTTGGPILIQSGQTVIENQALQPLPPVMGLIAVAGDQKVTLSWTAVTGATGYNVKRSLVSGGPYTTIAAGIPATTYVDTGLTDGVTYYYVVSAIVGGGEGPDSAEASATPVPIAQPPINLTATPGNASVTLNWTASATATSYNVYRGLNPGAESPKPVATGVTGTTFTDTGLTNGTTYYYVVTAVNGAGESGLSNEASATPIAPPPAPTNLMATGGKGSVILNWSAAATATSYNVYRGIAAGAELSKPVATGIVGTSYVDNGLTAGTTYYYVVKAMNAGGESGPSNEASATPPTPPGMPINLVAVAGNASVTLSWTAPTGAAGYNIYRGTTSGAESSNPINQTVVTGTTYTDTGLTPGQTYYYLVAAVNVGGTSAFSNEASATPPSPPVAPANLTAVPGRNSATLTWVAAAGATSYNIYRGTNPGAESGTAIATNVKNTTFTDTGLTAGQTYYYVVAGVNVAGQGAFSNEVAVTPPTPPRPVTNLTASVVSSTQINISWTDTTADATGFNIYRMVSGGSFALISSVSGNVRGYQDTGLRPSTTYTYMVEASNVGGVSPSPNPTVTATTLAVPAAPSGLTATEVSGNQVNLAWTESSTDVVSFKIERMQVGGAFAEIATVGANALTYTDTTVSPNITYTYRVRALNANGPSDYSNLATVTTGTDVIGGTIRVAAGGVNQPLPGVTVQLLNGAGTSAVATVKTDQAGHYSFPNLTDGVYVIAPMVTAQTPVQPVKVTVNASVNNGVVTQDFTINPLAMFPVGLSLLSVPYDYSGTGVDAAAVFGVQVKADGSAPIAGFDPVSNTYQIYPSLPISGTQTLPGRGYWVKEATAQPFLLAGKPVSSPLEITLSPGWNLIGDPFLNALAFSNIQVKVPFQVGSNPSNSLLSLQTAQSSGIVGNTIWQYSQSSNQYQPASSLQPFQGYWMFISPQGAQNQAVTLRFTNPSP